MPSNALSVLFKHFIYMALSSKQHFRIANGTEANEKLVTPFGGSVTTLLSANLNKTWTRQRDEEEGKKKKKDTANLRTLSSSQQENTPAAVPAEAPQVAALQDSLQTERN